MYYVTIYIRGRSACSSPKYVVLKIGNRAGITFKLRNSSLFKKNTHSEDENHIQKSWVQYLQITLTAAANENIGKSMELFIMSWVFSVMLVIVSRKVTFIWLFSLLVLLNLRYYPDSCLEKLRKIIGNLLGLSVFQLRFEPCASQI
jgi:hypothetical protein